jgi:hypothetical protein
MLWHRGWVHTLHHGFAPPYCLTLSVRCHSARKPGSASGQNVCQGCFIPDSKSSNCMNTMSAALPGPLAGPNTRHPAARSQYLAWLANSDVYRSTNRMIDNNVTAQDRCHLQPNSVADPLVGRLHVQSCTRSRSMSQDQCASKVPLTRIKQNLVIATTVVHDQ